ncbi:hypothetical protein SAMN05444287_2410 [Octadecabacter temperatus]|uniref:Uncharacterized protein n=1 Tax=Octadecabacter temperatus TaxID=1458307 RepID=A0A0K0Y1A0_9RHOB|nr:hypothetical protein [Octadecabacter temperatus]AKS44676.1 hypothetical protein OSB_01070 [Octadecabacter temperatus]SIO36636.1 hypothetical protein SAMN05444287_2410 [Octadecabacter temperatus]
MKNVALSALVSVMLASSAAAGGISFSLPNLTFPPVSETTVSKDCQSFDVTNDACSEQE